jgi:diadenosine tetraphosphate (Ap4A) HIT family hydrolase
VTATACPACAGQWPDAELRIADCGSTIAYLHDDQFFEGWTVLVLKRHATELWELEPDERARLIEEVSRVAEAVGRAFGAAKLNYELLGNVLPHIHWHLIPRRADDPSPKAPAWTVAHEPRRLEASATAERVARVRAHLGG